MKLYRKKGVVPMRPYESGEDMTGISVSDADTLQVGGMIAHNPDNPDDRWYVGRDYFQKHYEEVK